MCNHTLSSSDLHRSIRAASRTQKPSLNARIFSTTIRSSCFHVRRYISSSSGTFMKNDKINTLKDLSTLQIISYLKYTRHTNKIQPHIWAHFERSQHTHTKKANLIAHKDLLYFKQLIKCHQPTNAKLGSTNYEISMGRILEAHMSPRFTY